MRQGAELVRATQPYAKELPFWSWFHVVSTILAWVGSLVVTLSMPWWPLQLASSVLTGMLIVRLFIIFHDVQHGSLFRHSRVGRWTINWVGWLTLSPPSVWKETHDYHHMHNAKLLGSAIGSFPLVTVNMWGHIKPGQKRMYRFIRHPLTIGLGLFTAFMIGFCYSAFRRDPKRHWQGPVALVLYWAVFAVLWAYLGLWLALCLQLIPGIVSSAVGTYLFYAQHNFPGAEMLERRDWNYHHAALRCSSYFKMSPIMHWFTGNIGYHHVHHLNHRIPFYRLPEAMAALPELQTPITTTWAPSDVWACLRIGLWDPFRREMITLAEGESLLAERSAQLPKG